MDLLYRIQRHLRESGTSATRFGRDVLGDPNFVGDLRNGREPRAGTVRQVLDYLERSNRSRAA
jgi:hypothetical protein